MKTVLLATAAPEWRAFLARTPHDFYHLPEYVEVVAAQEQGEGRALLVHGDHGQLLLPLVARKLPGGRWDATSPYGYPGPLAIAGSEAFVAQALAVGLDALRDAGCVSAFIRFHPLLNPTVPQDIGTVVNHGDTVDVDLMLDERALWRQIRSDHRRDIARAIRSGCVVRMDETWGQFDSFRRLYLETMRRHAAAAFYFFDDAYFEGLRRALGERIHLCVVEVDSTLASAGLFVETCGIVQYHLSGTDEAAIPLRPTKLMLSFVEHWGQARGDAHLHLGGGIGGRNDSLQHFKAGFSPIRYPYRTLRVVLDEHEYARQVAARDPAADPAPRDGFFPLYRQG